MIFQECYIAKQMISTSMDISSSYLSKKLLPTSDILLVWGGKRSPKFARYSEIWIVAVVQSNVPLFAFGGKFKL